MMPFTDLPFGLLPKPLIAFAILWGLAHYFLVGPLLAERIVRADFARSCENAVRAENAHIGTSRLGDLAPPAIDGRARHAAEQTERVLNSPFLKELRRMSGGMEQMFGFDVDAMTNDALSATRESEAMAQSEYEAARARIEAETAARMAAAGSVCGCLAIAAIQDTRGAWALLTGSLSLIRRAPLPNFDQAMLAPEHRQACAPIIGGGS